jgi:hypothetical protein
MTDLATVLHALERIVTELSPDELPALVGRLEAMKATAWARLTMPPPPAVTERLVNANELAPIINRPAWSVRDLARREVIPSIQIGRLRKYRPSAVIAALEKGNGHRIATPVRAEKRRPQKGQCPTSVQVELTV